MTPARSGYIFRTPGRLAQLVEHLAYTEAVGGSSPSAPTTIFKVNSLKNGKNRAWRPKKRREILILFGV